MSVQEQEETNSVFKRFETCLYARVSAELGSLKSFSVCIIKLRFVFVSSGVGGHEGELGSVLQSERHSSLHAHRTWRVKDSVQLFRVLCLNDINSLECLNWQGLKRHHGYTLLFTRSAMGYLMTTESQELGLTSHPKDGCKTDVNCPDRLFRLTDWPL